MEGQKELLIWTLLSVFFGGAGASVASIRKSVSVGQSLIAISVSCIFSAASPFCLTASGVNMAWSVIISATLGILIFGFLALADKTEKQIPNVDVTGLLPGCLADKLKPKPPSEPPTDGAAK